MTNIAISSAAVASWAVPEVAQARSKRYAATLQKVGNSMASIFPSVPAALRSLGIESGWRTIRAAARDHQHVEVEVEGATYVIAALEISE